MDITQPITTKHIPTAVEIPELRTCLADIYNVSVHNRFEVLTYIKDDVEFEWIAAPDGVMVSTVNGVPPSENVTPSENDIIRRPLLTADAMAVLDKKMAALLAGDTAWWQVLRGILKAGVKEDLEKWFACLARDAAEAQSLQDPKPVSRAVRQIPSTGVRD